MKRAFYILSITLLAVACKKDVPQKKEAQKLVIDTTSIVEKTKDTLILKDTLPIEKEVVKVAPPKKKRKKKKVYRKSTSTHKELIFNVQLGINPKRKNWVLFENGTYVMFPDGYTNVQMKGAAIKFLREYDEKAVSVEKSNFAKGWIASTGKGLYNYIDPSSLGRGIQKDSKVKAQGRDNLLEDKKELNVVHVNSNK